MYFYPRSPCGERPDQHQEGAGPVIISIHALLAESDGRWRMARASTCTFLSTLSLRRATQWTAGHIISAAFLSTLSLRRATRGTSDTILQYTDFYPRSPCGERPYILPFKAPPTLNFYPRSPCGERPRYPGGIPRQHVISIHALLAESDPRCYDHRPHLGYFYPRSPCGERLLMWYQCNTVVKISIHALLAESDAG